MRNSSPIAIRGAHLVTIADAAHNLPTERPDEVNAEIEKFLAESKLPGTTHESEAAKPPSWAFMSIRPASRPTRASYQIMAESVRGALADAGLTIKDVDGMCTAGMGMGPMGSLASATT